MPPKDRIGEVHGDFRVVGRAGSSARQQYATWRLACAKGHRIVVSAKDLARGSRPRCCDACRIARELQRTDAA